MENVTGPQSAYEEDRPLPVLPLAGGAPGERADAARNRERILAAAKQLFDERGAEAVSMDEIAAAAGVGKGTLYRRFGDRATLARTLIGEGERRLQEGFIRGPAPLGPGVPPVQRLHAFVDALLDLTEDHLDLLHASEAASGAGRWRSGVLASYHAHAAVLLGEARPEGDADHLAYLLLAPLSADLHRHLREERGFELERLRTGMHALVDGLAGG